MCVGDGPPPRRVAGAGEAPRPCHPRSGRPAAERRGAAARARPLRALSLQLLLAGVAAGARLHSPDDGGVADDGDGAGGDGAKQITFLRHGESAGNLMAKRPLGYLSEFGSKDAWKDGQLSQAGEREALQSVKDMDADLLDRITGAELVLASPLQRSMATAVLLLAGAYSRNQGDVRELRHKRFAVVTDLREKVSSDSDVPGTNPEDVKSYLARLARRYGEALFGDPEALLPAVTEFLGTYRKERLRTRSWGRGATEKLVGHGAMEPIVDLGPQQRQPGDAGSFLQQIQHFREYLSAQGEQRVLIVGHNGWARSAFCAGLTPLCPGSAESMQMRLAFGARWVQELPNLGVLTADFRDGLFEHMRVRRGKREAGNCSKKGKLALITSLEEMKDSSLVDEDALMYRVFMYKRMDFGRQEERLITISSSQNKTYLAWGGPMGQPKKLIDLSSPEFGYSFSEGYTVKVFGARGGNVPVLTYKGEAATVWPFTLTAKSSEDFTRLRNLLALFVRFGTDTAFLGSLLEREGWVGPAGVPDKFSVAPRLAEWEREAPPRSPAGGGGRPPAAPGRKKPWLDTLAGYMTELTSMLPGSSSDSLAPGPAGDRTKPWDYTMSAPYTFH